MVQARVGDATFDIETSPDGTTVDGEPRDVRLSPLGGDAYLLVLDGRPQVVTLARNDDGTTTAYVGSTAIPVTLKTETDLLLERFGMDTADADAEREVRAPMPGLVLRVLVEPGETVEAGQGLLVLEAMKMENELKAAAAGTVAAIHAAAGQAVGKNDVLIEMEG